MNKVLLFEFYKLFLWVKALELGMPQAAAEAILSLERGLDVLVLIDFLVDCYGADYVSLQPWLKRKQEALYLASGEPYNEWETE